MATEDETDLDLLLELLDDIQPECGNREKDDLAKDEQKAFRAKGQEEHEKQKKELELKSLQQDIDERKGYATKIFFLVCVWLATVLLIVAASGCEFIRLTVSDTVLVALISGVSVNIIALFAIVANYLFPKR